MNDLHLQARNLLWMLLLCASSSAILGWYFLAAQFDALETTTRDRGRTVAGQLARASELLLLSNNRKELTRLASATSTEPGIIAVTIRDNLGDVVATAGMPTSGLALPTQGPEEMIANRDSSIIFFTPVFRTPDAPGFPSKDGNAGGLPATAPQQVGLISLEISRHALVAHKQRQLIYGVGIILAVLGLSTLAGLFLIRTLKLPRWDSVAGNTDLTTEPAAPQKQRQPSSANTTRLIADASHDIRQPLQALGLWVSALRSQAKEPSILDSCTRIEESVNTLGEMLNGLLDLSKIDAGCIVPQIQDVSLDGLFDHLESQFIVQAGAKGLRLRVHRGGLVVRSDAVLLGRILQHLLSNALRFTDQGSVLVCARVRGPNVRVEIRDSGRGIPFDKQAVVFEESFRIQDPERDRDRGLGLGLVIVRRFCILLGHRCEVRSAPDHGSVFSVTVPLTRRTS